MQNLWAPWRMEYILGDRPQGCIFCPDGNGETDEERLVLYRGELSMVVMNRFPYSNGHLLVAPWNHSPSLDGLKMMSYLICLKRFGHLWACFAKP